MATRVIGIASGLLLAVVAYALFFLVPSLRVQGDAARIVYFHVPIAWVSFLAFGVVSIGRGRWSGVVAAIGFVTVMIVTIWFDGPAKDWPPLIRAYYPDLAFCAIGGMLLWGSRQRDRLQSA